MAASRDLLSNIRETVSIPPQAVTADIAGSSIDTRGFESAGAIFHFGAITDGTYTCGLEESDDNSTFTAVAAADLIGPAPVVTATDDNVSRKLGYRGGARYIRATIAAAGATTGGIMGATLLEGHPNQAPVAD